MARALALIRRLDPIHAPATTSLFVDPVPTPAGPPHVNPVRFRARRLANPARAQGGEMMLLTPQRQSELFKSAEVRSAKAKKEAKTKA